MFPDINTNDGNVTEEWVLIGSGDNFKCLCRTTVTLERGKCVFCALLFDTYEPTPSRSLNSSGRRVEFLLEILKASKWLQNGSFKRSFGQFTSSSVGRCKVPPEQGVINMSWSMAIRIFKKCITRSIERTSTVELERSLESNSLLGSCGLGVRGLSSVQSVHVGLVVLGVVESHDLFRDVGLKGIIVVGKRRKSVGHILCGCGQMVVRRWKMSEIFSNLVSASCDYGVLTSHDPSCEDIHSCGGTIFWLSKILLNCTNFLDKIFVWWKLQNFQSLEFPPKCHVKRCWRLLAARWWSRSRGAVMVELSGGEAGRGREVIEEKGACWNCMHKGEVSDYRDHHVICLHTLVCF